MSPRRPLPDNGPSLAVGAMAERSRAVDGLIAVKSV